MPVGPGGGVRVLWQRDVSEGGAVGGGGACPFWTSDVGPCPCVPSSPKAGDGAMPMC